MTFFQTLDIVIRWISITETNCVIHGKDFYPVDSAIQCLNNQGQKLKLLLRSGTSRATLTDPPRHPLPHLFSRPRYNAEIQRFDELAEKWIKTEL